MPGKRKQKKLKHCFQNRHSVRRFKQRYGFDIEPEQILALVELAHRRHVHSLERDPHGRPHVELMTIRLKDINIRFVYDRDDRHILTFLPPVK